MTGLEEEKRREGTASSTVSRMKKEKGGPVPYSADAERIATPDSLKNEAPFGEKRPSRQAHVARREKVALEVGLGRGSRCFGRDERSTARRRKDKGRGAYPRSPPRLSRGKKEVCRRDDRALQGALRHAWRHLIKNRNFAKEKKKGNKNARLFTTATSRKKGSSVCVLEENQNLDWRGKIRKSKSAPLKRKSLPGRFPYQRTCASPSLVGEAKLAKKGVPRSAGERTSSRQPQKKAIKLGSRGGKSKKREGGALRPCPRREKKTRRPRSRKE